jgi:hypothetical protein
MSCVNKIKRINNHKYLEKKNKIKEGLFHLDNIQINF